MPRPLRCEGGARFYGEDGGTGERRYFLESRKYQRTCVVDGKAAGIKLEGGTAAPVAGKSLNCPDESRLSSVRFLLFPFGLASPALRRFHRHATGNGWTRKSCITAGDSWQGRLPKSLLIEEKVLDVVKRMRCSRRSGVIFYIVMITTTAWSTPHHRLRRSLSSRRSLLAIASMQQSGFVA